MAMIQQRGIASKGIRGSELELMIMLFPFFVPQYIMNLGFVSTLVEFYKLCVLFYVVINIRKTDSDLPLAFYLVMIFKGLDLIPFLLGNSFSFRTLYLWVKDFYSVILLCYIIVAACRKDYFGAVQKIYWILSMWIILHILCFYGTGIELIGIRTKISHSFIVCMTLCLVTKELSGKRFRLYDYIFLGLSIVYIVNRSISTVILTTAALFIGYFLVNIKSARKIINYYFMITAGIILNLSILFLRIQYFFSWMIVGILHEDLSLNKRTYIWDDVIRQLGEKLWLGHGIMGENRRTVQVNIVDPDIGMNLDSPIQVHNQLLSILYFNGVIGLGLFVAMLLSAGSRIRKCLNKRVAILLIFGMTAITLAGIAELASENFSFYVLLMCVAVCDYSNKDERFVEDRGIKR
jgi:O-antigen ligase